MVTQAAIPVELCEQLDRRNVLLFAGEGIIRTALPSSAELASELAQRCDYPPGEPPTLPRVAGYYVLTTRDRHGLIDFLRDRLDRPGLTPSPSHRLIAQLQPPVLVTTCYDRLLEIAMKDAAVPYVSVVGNDEVAYTDEQKLLLVWLWGQLERPDSMVITEDDHRQFLAGRENLSDVLRGELARRTWLFLGFDAEDEWFRNFYDTVTGGLDRHRRLAYIVGAVPSAYTRAWWAERAKILDVDIEPFLTALNSVVAARKQAESATPQPSQPVSAPLPERPYKLLDYYEAKDTGIFFGREPETQKLSALIHAHRLVVLHGASGTGKTSLLLAGVLPRLEHADPPYETLYIRTLEDPALVIRRAIRRRLPAANLPEDGSLVDFLDAATRALERPLVIVLDQFEEFFIRFNPKFRAPFIAELGALYDARDVPVKVVFSLREDWLASLSEIEARIPEVYRTRLRLLPLSRDQARQAITAPVERMGMRYDPALVDRLLDDLVDEVSDVEGAVVMPPQLQLVCDALYEHTRAENRQLIAIADYEAVGGTQGILARYIESALHEHPGPEREVAKEVLMALTTSQSTKAWTDLKTIVAQVGADSETVERVLSRLTGQRLVRRLDESQSYELAHDVLAATIAGWIGEEDRQLKQVRELLQRELVDWRLNSSVLLSQSKFQNINAVRERLRLTPEEAAYLLRASILYGENVSDWLAQVNGPDAQANILLEMLRNDAPQARLTAAQYLAGFPQAPVATALAHTTLEDAAPAVRDMAAASLARIGDRGSLKLLVETAQARGSPPQMRAVRALALMRDVAPDSLREVVGPIRRQVNLQLAKIRFWRHWPSIRRVTALGALGGPSDSGSVLPRR